ncbi:nidogen-1-like isoform X2 [Macrobrachium nipponense]|uniref:nidogen-1-like isoform X2 n=1 Tax=Macrobrachium nipponense TaxID=159736 RepID=UPI0030C83961
MTNNIRRLISIIWLWTLCVGDIMEEKLIRYESTTDIEGLAVTTRECGNDDPTNKAVVRLEIDCDENILSIRNEVNALRESIKKDVYTIAQSLQTCSSDIISDIISKLLSKDECAGTNNCSANADCIDGVLSYRCNCRPGYQGDGFTCSDVDECSSGNHLCHSRANCTNTIGSYTCRCRPPYSGNGYTCNDIACGSPAKLIEGLGCVIPVEERMIWTRARDYCHRLGYRLLEGITNTDQLNQLKEHFDRGVFSFPQSIHDVWLGIKDNRWVEGPDPRVPPNMWDIHQLNKTEFCGYVALQMSPPTLWDGKCLTHSLPFFCQAMLE